MCSPLLFLVFLRPSFGACAPPSPNSRQNLNYLRRVGRLTLCRFKFAEWEDCFSRLNLKIIAMQYDKLQIYAKSRAISRLTRQNCK